jgi:hypothetical protein
MTLQRLADLMVSGRCARLRPRAVVVYLCIVARAERGLLSPSRKVLAADTGLDRGTVARALVDLRSCGILHQGRR